MHLETFKNEDTPCCLFFDSFDTTSTRNQKHYTITYKCKHYTHEVFILYRYLHILHKGIITAGLSFICLFEVYFCTFVCIIYVCFVIIIEGENINPDGLFRRNVPGVQVETVLIVKSGRRFKKGAALSLL